MTSGKNKLRSFKLSNKNQTNVFNRIIEFVSQKFFLLCIGNVILLTILLCPKIDFFFDTNLVEGEISPKNFWAPRDLSIEDTRTTEKKKAEVLEKTQAIYDFDDKSFEVVSSKITNAFTQLRTLYNKLLELQTLIQSEIESLTSPSNTNNTSPSPSPADTSDVDSIKAESIEKVKLAMQQILTSELGQNYQNSVDVLSFFIREKMSYELENYTKEIFASILNKFIVDNKAPFLQDLENGIQMNYLHSKRKVNFKPEDGANVLDLNSAKAEIESMMKEAKLTNKDMNNLTTFVLSLLRPNLTFNKSETENAKKSAIEKIEPVFFTFKKGQMILRERDKVTADHILILNSIKQKFILSDFLLRTSSFAFLLLLLISIVFLLLNELSKLFRGNFKSHLIFSVVIIFYIVLTKAQIWISNSIADTVQNDSLQNLSSYYYLLPMSLGPFLVTLLLDFPSGLMMAFLASLLMGVLPSFNTELIILGFVAGFVASFWIRRYNSRTGIMKTGLIVGIFNAFFITFSSMQQIEIADINITLFKIGCSFFGGVLASVITLVALPAFEGIFKVTTDIKLLELSDTNNPLLKTLASNAPGTFSHTMRVAELSEAAAQAINANHILARVAALYHDIGKVNKSSYFVENFRFHERNPHDKLNPNMSKTIILSHVKEGIEIAEEYGLPSSIIDAIKQHQGSGLITVFYQKAQELAKEKDETVVEGDFRYPGPKPQNKEMAIIMLADGIEAASRTLMDPTPSSIKTFVEKMFEKGHYGWTTGRMYFDPPRACRNKKCLYPKDYNSLSS